MSKSYVSFPLWGGIRLIRPWNCGTALLLIASVPAFWVGLVWFVANTDGFLHGLARMTLVVALCVLPWAALAAWACTIEVRKAMREREAWAAARAARRPGTRI